MKEQVPKSITTSTFGKAAFIRQGIDIIFILLFLISSTVAHKANNTSGVLSTSLEPPAAVLRSAPSTEDRLIRSLKESCLY